MGLWRNDIKDVQHINDLYIDGDRKTIDYNIRHIVKDSSMSDYFEQYIQEYEYKYKCFDKGNDFYEKKSLMKHKSYPVKECKIVRYAYYCTKCGVYVEDSTEYCTHCNVELNWNNIKKDYE